MSKLNFLHLCDYAALSKDGKVNIMGIIEHIWSKKVPSTFPQFYVVLNFSISEVDSDKPLTFQILDDYNEFVVGPTTIPLPDNPSSQESIGTIIQINSMEVKRYGDYQVQVFVGNTELENRILQVTENPISITG